MHYTLTYAERDYSIGQALFFDDKISAMVAYLNALWYGHRNISLNAYNDSFHWTTIKPVHPTKDLPF